MTTKPEQMELPGMESAQELELSSREMILLFELASTGRDAIRRELLSGQLNPQQSEIAKNVMTRADVLLSKLEDQGYGRPPERVN